MPGPGPAGTGPLVPSLATAHRLPGSAARPTGNLP